MISPYRLLKYNRLVKSHTLKCLGVLVADALRIRHLSVRMDPFMGCNLRCQMCHFSSPEYQGRKAEIIPVEDYTRIAKLFFRKSIQVILGCGAEPTLHPQLPELVRMAKSHGVPFVGMATNGQFLTEPLARRLVEAGIDEIMISMHGVRKETYERLQPPARYEKLHGVLATLTKLSEEHSRSFQVRINFTLNPDNQGELDDFFTVFGDYRIDILQIRKVFDLGDTVYHNLDLSPFAAELVRTARSLKEECRRRGTILLSPSFEEEGNDPNPLAAILLPLVHRHVVPGMVWKPDFDWRTESYEDYLRRIGWRRQLLRVAFSPKARALEWIHKRERSLAYDVD